MAALLSVARARAREAASGMHNIRFKQENKQHKPHRQWYIYLYTIYIYIYTHIYIYEYNDNAKQVASGVLSLSVEPCDVWGGGRADLPDIFIS